MTCCSRCTTAGAEAPPYNLLAMLSRERAIETLEAEPFDLAVIGGGITGAGVALDAASRGYSVALIERRDYAAGTSSRSSKLVHGGLRYLQNFDLGLVREALLERSLLVALAPHLVRPLPLVVPAFAGARPDRLIGVGLRMYDVMATRGLRERRDARRSTRRLGSGAEDLDLSAKEFRLRVNADLANNIGNLANRSLSMLANVLQRRLAPAGAGPGRWQIDKEFNITAN